MISVSAFLCLALCIGAVVGFEEEVDCGNCTFYNGVGFVKSEKYAVAFYVCVPDGDGYEVETLCCATNMTFDPEHLTCVVDTELDKDLDESWCPEVGTVGTYNCSYWGVDKAKVFQSLYDGSITECAPGTWWNQENCTCVHGDPEEGCSKIIHFDFSDGYDSESCNYIIDGTPYYFTKLEDDALCLDGLGFVAVAFLNNWFAWNPTADQFTFCARANPRREGSNGCIFSTNCNTSPEGSLLELGLVDGELEAYLGSDESLALGVELAVGEFSQICVTYDFGNYTVSVNGEVVVEVSTDAMPINSQTESFIGMNRAYGYFDGYIDDVCFWTEFRTKEQIAADHSVEEAK